MVFPHHGAVLTNLVSMIIPNVNYVKQADIFFTLVRCTLVFPQNGTDTELQSLSCVANAGCCCLPQNLFLLPHHSVLSIHFCGLETKYVYSSYSALELHVP